MPAEKRKRQSYTYEFKLKVVAFAEEKGNRVAAREFLVDESMVRYWRKAKENMKEMPKRRHTCRVGKTKFPNLERNLKQWVVTQRTNSRPVTTVMIRLKAKELAKDMNIEGFVGGPSWCFRFMRRNRLSVRTRTTVGQKLPDDWEEKVQNFREFVTRRKEELNVGGDNVINMDEVPMSFDAPFSRTVDNVGASTVPIATTGHEKTHFTVILACTESGKKLKPMVVFKRKTMPKEKLPTGVVVHVQEKGWVDTNGMKVWAEKVWRSRPVPFFNKTTLLIMDSFSAHIDKEVREKLKKEHKTTTAIIPGGLTKKLQPLDISVNRSFKASIRNEWEQWMSEGLHTFTGAGKIRRASLSEVCGWVVRAWESVNVRTIVNGFRKAGIVSGAEEESEEETETEEDIARLNAELLELFNSDTEDEDFEGF